MLNHVLAIILICIVFFTCRYIWNQWQRGDLNYHTITKLLTRKRTENGDFCKSDASLSNTIYSFCDNSEDKENVIGDGGGGGDADTVEVKQKGKRVRKWSFDVRKWMFDYIAALDDRKRSKFEVRLWRGLNSYISEEWKDRNQEMGITYPLPLWIEELMRLIRHENTKYTLLLIVIYVVCIVIVYPLLSWLFIEIYPFVIIVLSSIEGGIIHGSGNGGGVNAKISKEEADNIAKLIDMYPTDFIYDYESASLYYNCQSFYSFIARHIHSTDGGGGGGVNDTLSKWFANYNIAMNHSYCQSTRVKEMWLEDDKSWPLLFTNHHYDTGGSNHAAAAATSHSISEIFLDSRYRIHFLLNIIESSSSSYSPLSIDRGFTNEKRKPQINIQSKSKTVLVNENTIINLLNHIENETRQTCICPLLVGIRGNLTFLYRESMRSQKWIILHEPYLYRNNTLSDEVETSITFDKQELPVFFHNNQQLTRNSKDAASTAYDDSESSSSSSSSTKTLRHYNIFNVEYTQINRIDDGDDSNDDSIRIHKDEVNSMKMQSMLLDDDKRLLFMPFKSVGHYQTRERLILSENEAICFIHCNEMNK
jgi:hypothetical protein